MILAHLMTYSTPEYFSSRAGPSLSLENDNGLFRLGDDSCHLRPQYENPFVIGHEAILLGHPCELKFVFLKGDAHYETITKLPGFFSRGYYCTKCDKPYNTEEFTHHS